MLSVLSKREREEEEAEEKGERESLIV